MIGNDIVDLRRAKLDSNWERRGFLKKIFTPQEREHISQASNPFQLVWRLWSMKESAYKLHLQMGGHRFFNPTKISCETFDSTNGSARIGDTNFTTNSTTKANFVFSTAQKNDRCAPDNAILILENDEHSEQSRFTKNRLLQSIAETHSLKLADLSIQKNQEQIPQVFHQGEELNVSISLSHHGFYGAFSILKN